MECARVPSFGRALFLMTGALLAAGYAWLYYEQSRLDPADAPDSPSLTRLRSVESLAARGVDAVPQLIAQLSAPDPADRDLAAIGLTRIGPGAEAAVPALSERLDDDDAQVRANSLLALGRIDSGLEALAPRVAMRLDDSDREVRRNAAHVLIVTGPVAAPLVLSALEQPGFEGVEQAILALRQIAVDAEATRSMLRPLAADSRLDPRTREEALEALLALGGATPDEIRQGLTASRPDAFRFALAAACRETDDRPGLMPLIIDRLSTFMPAQRQPTANGAVDLEGDRRRSTGSLPSQVLIALGELGPEARDAIPQVCRLLQGETLRDDFRLLAIRTLARIGADRPRYVEELVRLFVDARYLVPHDRLEADEMGRTLHELAPEQISGLIRRLTPGLTADDPVVRRRTFAQFREFGPAAASALPAALDALRRGDDIERCAALQFVAVLGPHGAAALPELAALLREPANGPKAALIGEVAQALRQIGRPAIHLVPDLIGVVQRSGSAHSSRFTIESGWGPLGALSELAGNDERVITFLRSGLSDSRVSIRLDSAARLIELNCDLERVIALLVDELEMPARLGPETLDRSCAVSAQLLARLGPRAQRSIGALTNALTATSAEQQQSAALALAAIVESCSPEGDDASAVGCAVAPLTALLSSSHPSVRRAAAHALGAIGPAARPALPSLDEALRDRSNAQGYGRNPYGTGYSETDYVSPIFVKADRSKYAASPTVREEVQLAIRKISLDLARR